LFWKQQNSWKGALMGASTSVSHVTKAPRERVYQAFMDGESLAAWLAPGTMKGQVHRFEPREGGEIYMTLSYPNIDETPDGLIRILFMANLPKSSQMRKLSG
jgi:hypothetical protein